MRAWLGLLLIWLVCGSVHVLNEGNFRMTDSGRWVLDFYAPWCPHCKALEPIFDDAARNVANAGIDLQFGKVDCDDQPALCKTLGINGFPDIKFSAWGYRSEWMLGRGGGDFISFAHTLKTPAMQTLDKDINAYPQLIKMILIGGNKEQESSWSITAEKLRTQSDLVFLATQKPTLIPRIPSDIQVPSIVFISDDPNEEPSIVPYPEDEVTLFNTVLNHSKPMFPELTSANWRHITNTTSTVIGVLTPGKHQSFYNAMKSVASKLRGQYQFGWMDYAKYGSFLVRTFYIDTSSAILVLSGKDHRYVDRNPEDQETHILQFLTDVKEQRVEVEGPSTWKGILKHYIYSVFYAARDQPLLFGSLAVLVTFIFGVLFFCTPDEGTLKED
jgi:thiol-disulfide isomerase/thioredoxin